MATPVTPTTPPPAGPFAHAAPLVAWLAHRAALDASAHAAVLGADAAAAADGAEDPERLARALLSADRASDALRLTACALPPREGVWWAWVAARHALDSVPGDVPGGAPPADRPAERAALAAAERWIAEPTDAYRRAAWDAGQAAGLDTPAGSACAAAYFATGSLAPPSSPMAVPPPPGAHATLAAGAALLAAARIAPERLGEVAGAFITQGAEIVRRLGGWDASATLARRHFDAQQAVHAATVRSAAPNGGSDDAPPGGAPAAAATSAPAGAGN